MTERKTLLRDRWDVKLEYECGIVSRDIVL